MSEADGVGIANIEGGGQPDLVGNRLRPGQIGTRAPASGARNMTGLHENGTPMKAQESFRSGIQES
jgi:hypothetical protein